MTTQSYEQTILQGLKGLPLEALNEISDFVYFVRRRILHPQAFHDDIRELMLREELKQLSRDEEMHCEKELEGYEQLYPRQ
jgi:hypothetical protein